MFHVERIGGYGMKGPWVKYGNRPKVGRPAEVRHQLGVKPRTFTENILSRFGDLVRKK